MKEVAIFGGTFDPPTKAHEGIIQACLERPDIDEVWLMPSGRRPDKPYMSNNAARLVMLELVKIANFDNTGRLLVTDFEQQLPQPTETCRTVEALEHMHPDKRFWHVYGADVYEAMPAWRDGERLQHTLGMLLVERHGYELPPESATIRHLESSAIDLSLSSTAFREAYEATLPTKEYISPAVLRYISQQALYGVGRPLSGRL